MVDIEYALISPQRNNVQKAQDEYFGLIFLNRVQADPVAKADQKEDDSWKCLSKDFSNSPEQDEHGRVAALGVHHVVNQVAEDTLNKRASQQSQDPIV